MTDGRGQTTKTRRAGWVGGTLIALVAMAASAQSWPARPVRLIVPFPPGGSADILGRTLGAKLAEGLSQQVVVDNRPGAGTAIGTEATAKSPPDGYTIMIGTVSSHAINPSLNSKLGYDPVRDFAPVSLVASIAFVLLAHPSVPAATVSELIALARTQSGKLNYSSAGSGTSNHLAGELFNTLAKVAITHVPYKGSAPALADLLGGQVQLMFDLVLTAVPHVKSGAVRALAVTGRDRAGVLPQVPTVAESGLADYEVSAWFAIFAPAGTPPPVIARLNAEVVRALGLPDVRERLASQGADPVTSTPEATQAYVRSELAKWSQVVKASGMKVE